MGALSPAALIRALTEVLELRSPELGKSLCTKEGWTDAETGVHAFLETALKQGYRPFILDETCQEGDRAYVATTLTGRAGRPLGRAYWMARLVGDEWKLTGISRNVGPAVLFVSEQASPSLTWETLPPGPEAKAWFTRILDAVRAGDESALATWAETRPVPVRWLLPRLHMLHHQLKASVRCGETRAHRDAGRFAALLEIRMSDGAQEAFWVMLRQDPQTRQLEPFETSSLPSLQLLLQGIDMLGPHL